MKIVVFFIAFLEFCLLEKVINNFCCQKSAVVVEMPTISFDINLSINIPILTASGYKLENLNKNQYE